MKARDRIFSLLATFGPRLILVAIAVLRKIGHLAF